MITDLDAAPIQRVLDSPKRRRYRRSASLRVGCPPQTIPCPRPRDAARTPGTPNSAQHWAGKLRGGTTVCDIAKAASASESYIARVIPLAMLSPKIQDAIVSGSQPLLLNLEALVRTKLPVDWAAQERLLAFAS
ncbi:MAG: hypothetical protein LCH69_00620 [Proteobacteria bacterium]|nr:hypothetical protein [Pseudomonadota bacterium]